MDAICCELNVSLTEFVGEVERAAEQCRLRFLPRSHHRQSLPTGRIESATYASIKPEFFNEIRRKATDAKKRRNVCFGTGDVLISINDFGQLPVTRSALALSVEFHLDLSAQTEAPNL